MGREVRNIANTINASKDNAPKDVIVIELVPKKPNNDTNIIPNKYFLGRDIG